MSDEREAPSEAWLILFRAASDWEKRTHNMLCRDNRLVAAIREVRKEYPGLPSAVRTAPDHVGRAVEGNLPPTDSSTPMGGQPGETGISSVVVRRLGGGEPSEEAIKAGAIAYARRYAALPPDSALMERVRVIGKAMYAVDGRDRGSPSVDLTAWLIERQLDGPTLYLCYDDPGVHLPACFAWRTSHENALRFARKQDGERFLQCMQRLLLNIRPALPDFDALPLERFTYGLSMGDDPKPTVHEHMWAAHPVQPEGDQTK